MAEAKNGDTVTVHYTGKFDDGTTFDSSENHDPLCFTIGKGQIVPGFEQAIIGMNPGDKKTAAIPTDQAYGVRHEELAMKVERSQFPENVNFKVGQQFVVTITDISDSHILLDGNHPLAGKDLTFDIELVKID